MLLSVTKSSSVKDERSLCLIGSRKQFQNKQGDREHVYMHGTITNMLMQAIDSNAHVNCDYVSFFKNYHGNIKNVLDNITNT